ncbi:TRAP transporter small permease [Nitratireductor aquibiodomus]|uniref:TRAP transporter small permease protein n=1 Tax=Nitratireductor aquibiodomus TaxID=204799 RepID=A0A1H4Q3Q3_9HYPH|nr:TRAP transporter small permease subunit [Nitratireductor aquibiodomus]SEC14245.1 TRAP-type C4-dicarboxylate transport system, small permease component [Nitratireductor aquibiodomus]
MARLAHWLDLFLQVVTLTLLLALSCVVVLGVAFRYSGNSLIWYDEVAAVLLAWITFSGAALATLRNAHLGFNGLLLGSPPAMRMVLFWLGEAIFAAVFAAMLWAGWAILDIFGNESMTTLRFVPRSFVQSILPISAGLMLAGRLLTLPQRLGAAQAGIDHEAVEIEHEIARAQEELSRVRAETSR